MLAILLMRYLETKVFNKLKIAELEIENAAPEVNTSVDKNSGFVNSFIDKSGDLLYVSQYL
ncbi:hypothetical protein HOI83_02745 [Candidatus Uhrbacteria bacterium]|nr:hypothetical protein [Candidatus Uhrbacteria bacterium]